MRKLWVILLVLILVVQLTACAGNESKPSTTSPPKESGDAPEPSGLDETRQIKDEIVFAQGQDIYSLVPWFTRLEKNRAVSANIFETLVAFDSNLEIVPVLATSWEWVDDTTAVFQIRENVYFHNGDLMEPSDVAYSLNVLANEPYMAMNAGWIKEAVVTGDHEVTLYLKDPYGAALGALCHPAMIIASEKYMEDPSEKYETEPVGTGAYKMKEYKLGEYYTMERHEQYWGDIAPTKLLTLKIVPESTQRTIMLETGMLDVAYEIPMNDYSRIENDDDLKLWVSESVKTYMFFLNCNSKGPTGNKLVRQALLHAMDSASIVESMLYGYGEPATNLIVPGTQGYIDRSEDLRYDPELSKQLLAEAGYPDGCEITVWTSSEQNRVEMCQIYQDLCREVGIELKIEIMDQSTMYGLRDAGEDYGMILHFYNNMTKHIDQTLYGAFHSTMKSNNNSQYNNPDYDALMEKVRTTPEGQVDQLMELAVEAYDILFEDVPAVPVYFEQIVIASVADLEGLFLSPVGGHRYQNAFVYID